MNRYNDDRDYDRNRTSGRRYDAQQDEGQPQGDWGYERPGGRSSSSDWGYQQNQDQRGTTPYGAQGAYEANRGGNDWGYTQGQYGQQQYGQNQGRQYGGYEQGPTWGQQGGGQYQGGQNYGYNPQQGFGQQHQQGGYGQGSQGSPSYEGYEGQRYQSGQGQSGQQANQPTYGPQSYGQQGQGWGAGSMGGGQQRTRYGNDYGQQRTGKAPKNFTRSDERLQELVCDTLVDRGCDCSEVEVEVKDGVVNLSGLVHERGEKHEFEWIAASVNGVQDVENKLRVDRDRSRSSSQSDSDTGYGKWSDRDTQPAGSIREAGKSGQDVENKRSAGNTSSTATSGASSGRS
jgi:osmotically-inducible protein OsmY